MKIKHYSKVTNENYLNDIKNLLILCDNEFVPKLSDRISTTQTDLDVEKTEMQIPEEYFNAISSQQAILAIENHKVVGFMSFRENYVCEHISEEYSPNIYITTIIVHPQYRNKGIAGMFYSKLMKKFAHHFLFTRTWSTNDSHIRILRAIGFHEHCYLNNDRGENIDTVYYRCDPRKPTIKQYINQYKLWGNFVFFLILLLATIIFVFAWLSANSQMGSEFALAVATSLMASGLCLVSDTVLKIRESKNDSFINKLKSFGIENLQFNKNEMLEEIIPKCREEIWISGCRLIMSSSKSFRHALVLACKRSGHMKIRILATPPWSTAYQLTYGIESVTMNYIRIIDDLLMCVDKYGLSLEVHFSEKPLFSDTYKVDNRFITGPYLHCLERDESRITANNFFSLDVRDPEKKLYQIIYSDYDTLWEESATKLNLQKYREKRELIEKISDLREDERIALLKSASEVYVSQKKRKK